MHVCAQAAIIKAVERRAWLRVAAFISKGFSSARMADSEARSAASACCSGSTQAARSWPSPSTCAVLCQASLRRYVSGSRLAQAELC